MVFTTLNLAATLATLAAVVYFGVKIMATQAELAQSLRDMTAQNEKARAEIMARLQELEDAIANAGNSTPEVDEALTQLRASIQADDDMNPDAPTEPPVPQA